MKDDLISRQAAIEKLKSNLVYMQTFGADRSVTLIEELPSAEPDNTDCDFCHEDIDGYIRPIEKNGHAIIQNRSLRLRANGWRNTVDINFCPMCGRRLKHG